MEKEQLISAKGLSIGYSKTKRKNSTPLYEDLSFDLYKGELVCLLGSNGAGKSTLLRTISRSQPVLKGEIFIEGKELSGFSDKKLSQLMGLVLTDKTSAGGLLVRELVELGRYPYTGFFGQLTQSDEDIVQKSMEDVRISHKANSYISELSDGEKQKVMIAKSLAQECPIVLLDEPTAFLDIESRIEIMSLLHRLARDKGKTILLSTHDVDMALILSDRLWLLSKECGLTSGITEDIVVSGALDNFFKGNNIVFDRISGNFFPRRKDGIKVYIDADVFLLRWIQNIFERHGFEYTQNSDCSICVKANQSDKIKVITDGVEREFNNFESLNTYLRNF